MNRKKIFMAGVILAYIIFLVVSYITGFNAGKEIGENFGTFAVEMLKILPCAFILIGLFEVWVSRGVVEKHLGEESGVRGYFWALIFAGTMVGGLYVALPFAYSLYNKGAKLGVIFAFISASAILRAPMTIFEASYLGIKFTMIRMLVSLPLVVITSMLLGRYLSRRKFRIREGN